MNPPIDNRTLIGTARSVVGQFDLDNWSSAGAVGAALQTESGDIFTGICLDLACGVGFCAEHSAIAEMLKARQRVIVKIVAVSADSILTPCGRCREMISQISPKNYATEIVIDQETTITLDNMLPYHWLTDRFVEK